MRPSLSSLKAPPRVYPISASGFVIWKKPSPSITRSSGFPVLEKSPWSKIFWTAMVFTPRPTWIPVGSTDPSAEVVPASEMVW